MIESMAVALRFSAGIPKQYIDPNPHKTSTLSSETISTGMYTQSGGCGVGPVNRRITASPMRLLQPVIRTIFFGFHGCTPQHKKT